MSEFHPLDPLRQVFSHERIGLILGAIALEAIAVAIVLPVSPAFCVVINMEPPGGAVYVLWAMGLGGALGVAFMVRRAIALRDVDRTALMIKLLHDPEDVVWVHAGLTIDYRMYGETVNRSRHVAVLTESRDNHSLEMAEAHAQRVLSALETYLPHATVGSFSPEAMARYKAEPASMRLKPRDEAREGGAYRDAAVVKKKVLPAPAASPYWLSALLCVALVLAAPTVTSLILGTPPANSSRPQTCTCPCPCPKGHNAARTPADRAHGHGPRAARRLPPRSGLSGLRERHHRSATARTESYRGPVHARVDVNRAEPRRRSRSALQG